MLCKTELLGLLSCMAPWPFRLPSLGKACLVLMRIYGELGRTARFPKCPGFLINSGLSRSYFASELIPIFDRVVVWA